MTLTVSGAMAARPDLHIADMASDSVIILDHAGTVQYWNPASEALYGWPALTIVGQSIDRLSEQNDKEQNHWRLLLQEGVWQGQVTRRNFSGTLVTADVRQYVRFHADGTPGEVVEYGRRSLTQNESGGSDWHIPDRLTAASWEIDISDARTIIEEIIAADSAEVGREARLFDIVQAARVIDVNDRTVRLVGGNRGRAVMIGQSVAAFWPLDSRAILADLLVEAASANTPGKICRRQLASDGILREPVVTLWLSDRPNRVFVAVNGTADDDRSYLYLRASEARYRKLIHYMPTALLQVDASNMGKIYAGLKSSGVEDFSQYLDDHPELLDLANETVTVTDVNRRAVEMFAGNSALDLNGPAGFLFAASRATLKNVMVGRFNGQASHSELTKIRTFDGRIVDVQLSVTYPIPPGELDVTIFSVQDVTTQLQMEAQLRQLQADFTHAARISTLGELTTSIAHEVNQPLAAILTNAETSLRWLSREDPNLAKVKELTTRIAAGARRANDIVQRIRGMAAKRQPERSALDINKVAQESLSFLRHEIESRNIRISTAFGRDMPQSEGDRIQLQQVIVNLLLNSIQALATQRLGDGLITIRTGTDDKNRLFLSIRDTGPGIPDAHIDRIFEGFFTTKEDGLGIGLGICHSIVMAHDGFITASNHEEGGAEFCFTLPAMGKPAA
ncbi:MULTISPECIES: ATP-binding protein [unclassified Sphingomonas]|uniref:ATP-binding protein n=1 Tax=unclassified Sphingomonas TaxID=196159 RepID=UPI0006F8FA8B|nr:MULTISPECIES: ATP-binding protein [unclassified Sphingomonas]KQX25021.1 PAS domain-containing sensor histidine kinase [Sphingomonas sp. Root1294]KQY66038.1 PAS domain-containing sensor histidine kinase [Sphingomonas sp. Root50]KRB89797.1 PAS domain-containing sensor histidine kinase [Sphingomonas sp. Root720]